MDFQNVIIRDPKMCVGRGTLFNNSITSRSFTEGNEGKEGAEDGCPMSYVRNPKEPRLYPFRLKAKMGK